MNISKENRDRIVKEFQEVAKLIENKEDPFLKMYYFSATFGIVQRVFNFEYDSYLLLIYLVLQAAYERINGRLNTIASGMERAIEIPPIIFDKLPLLINALADEIDVNNETGINNKLEEIAKISYLSTGNGYYLFTKGQIKFD